jgi:inositol-phosphate transport system ATP-binding protein
MRSEIRRIQRQTACTAILVTHDQIEAMSMCDRIALLNGGRIQQIGTPEEMYYRPATRFVASFIGSPPISFVEGTIRNGRFVTDGIELDLPRPASDAKFADAARVTIGIRPEDLGPTGALPIEGTITYVESQGRDTLYDVALANGTTLRSIQSGSPSYRPGQKIRWAVDPDRLYLFDANGDRIG